MVWTRNDQSLKDIAAASGMKDALSLLWRIPHNDEMAPEQIVIALRERIKELNCLYGIAQLAERHYDSLDELLTCLVDFLPLSWQYPEVTCARIVFDGKTYKGKNFKVTKWRQSSPILVYNEPQGEVAIFYIKERPPADEGPFLREERVMLDEIARRIAAIAVRMFAERNLQEMNRQLNLERAALQETNAALRTVLAKIEEDKQRIYKDLQSNVEKIVMPILQALALELPKPKRTYVDMLRTNLEEITSPFIRQLSQNHHHALTPTEIGICNMIRNGLRTKDIAQLRGVCTATINHQRERIRQKLKLTNGEVNLTTYLQSLPIQ
jgi:DNA-binding NarL/FixJ family response regulator